MNYLCHMLLSGTDNHILVGNFMGDFVKGPIGERFPADICLGINLHRRIDSFADRNELFRQSRKRISPDYGLFRGIMVDLFYDHFICRQWDELCPEPLDQYLSRMRSVVDAHLDYLPEQLQGLVPMIFEELLPSY